MRNLHKLMVFLLLSASLLAAQTKESLLIGPGDMLGVQVFETPDLEVHASVSDAGYIPLILGGDVHVAGLTPQQAAKVIEDVLLQQHYLLNPRVSVTVEQYATQTVSILGEVHTPGAYMINTPRSIVEVLALAGGLTGSANRNIMIERHGGSEKVSYYLSNDPSEVFASAMTIYPGDMILVPKAGIVYVLGDVGTPGGYTMTNNEGQISALQLVARAGGTPPTADPAHARLIRKTENGYTETSIPLSKMQKGKAKDIALQPNDIVFVPFSYLRNFAVSSSGIAASVGSAAIYKF